MAKGFRRQGEWQVGFQQRSMPSDVKRKLQRNKLMEQQAKEEINKRVQNAAEQAKEEQRQTNNILRVSNYEAQLASQFSNTLQNLLTNTVPSLAKDAIKYNNAAGAAARMEEELEVEPAPPELDPDDPAAGNYGLTEGRGFDVIQAAADQQLDITKTGNDLATKLENSGDPFGEEKARKVRGIFSGAYNYGYEVRDKALKVEGFAAHLDNQLKTNTTTLIDKNNVRFDINDPNLTKSQLALASNYILGEWVDANRGNLSDISTDQLLSQPARKVLATSLKTKFSELDNEFAARMLEGADLQVNNALDGIKGAPTISDALNSYVDLVKPHLKASKNSSSGNQAVIRLEGLIKDAFARAKDPDALHKRVSAALQVKSKTPAGVKSLAELHVAKFGAVPISILKQQAVSERHQINTKFQNARVETAVSGFLEEQRNLPKEERATESEKFDFVTKLLKNNPLATKSVLDSTSRIFIDPNDAYDSILEIKGKIIDNGGVILLQDISDPSLDIDAVKSYLEANPQVKVLNELYPESEKKDVDDVALSFKRYLADKGKAFSIDNLGNVTDASGTFSIAYSRFLSQIKKRAYEFQDAAKADGKPITYGEAIRRADIEMRGLINDAQTRSDKNSIYFIEKGLKGSGGFQNLAREQNIYPYLDNNNLKDIIATAKAEGLDLKTDEVYNNVDLNEDGFLLDPNAAKLAQVFNIPDYDFAKLQSNVFNMDFDAEPPIDFDYFKGLMNSSDNAFILRNLQSKGNTSPKVINRVLNDFYGTNERTLTEAWKNLDFTSVIRNEVTAQGLELDAGEIEIIDGEQYVGHRLIGITDRFGITREAPVEGASTYHTGIDIGTYGTQGFHTAFQMKDGIVVENGKDDKYGIYVDIQDTEGTTYRFAHLKNYNPKLVKGAAYNGEYIGEIGNTGASNREHLHLEKVVDGKAVDPASDLNKLTIGKRLEPTIGKYPFTARMIGRLTNDTDKENPISGLNVAKALSRYRENEDVQRKLWSYFNKKSWNQALRKAEGDLHLAARYHVAFVLRGDMDLYQLPTINAFANKYIHKLRTQGVLD